MAAVSFYKYMSKKIKISKQVIKDYEKLVSEISELNGLIYHNSSIAKIYLKEIGRWDKKRINDFLLGSNFIYYSPYNGKPIFGNFYTVKTKNLNDKISLLQRTTNNYLVAMAYEAFERFLRSITSRIITNNKKAAENVNPKLGFSSYTSCLLFLQGQYRNNADIISLLRKLSHELHSSFEKEKGLRNFLNFYRVYSKCRHHIIHSNSIVDINSFKRPEVVDEKFAIRYFGVYANKTKTKYIIDTTNTYREVLKTIASFAYLIVTSFDSKIIK